MTSLLHDVRYALRSCLRTPGFTFVAVAALALGIGANTAIFTVVNAVMLEPLPYRDPARLVVAWEDSTRHPGRPNVVAPANFLRWRDRATVFEHLAAIADYRVNLSGRGNPEELVVQIATPDFFQTLGVAPMRGRAFTQAEGGPRQGNANDVAILSYEIWERRFGADAGNRRPGHPAWRPSRHRRRRDAARLPAVSQGRVPHGQAARPVGAVAVRRARSRAARPLPVGDRPAEARRLPARGAGADGHDCQEPDGGVAAVRHRVDGSAGAGAHRACRRARDRPCSC